jgi:hypothetical protein
VQNSFSTLVCCRRFLHYHVLHTTCLELVASDLRNTGKRRKELAFSSMVHNPYQNVWCSLIHVVNNVDIRCRKRGMSLHKRKFHYLHWQSPPNNDLHCIAFTATGPDSNNWTWLTNDIFFFVLEGHLHPCVWVPSPPAMKRFEHGHMILNCLWDLSCHEKWLAPRQMTRNQ